MRIAIVPGIHVPTPLPGCAALRGQPCRPYQSYANTPSSFE